MDTRTKIQRLLAAPGYHPLRRAELARALALPAPERRAFRRTLEEMIAHGEVVRVRRDRFMLPGDADLVTGRIAFSEKGFAFVTPEPDLSNRLSSRACEGSETAPLAPDIRPRSLPSARSTGSGQASLRAGYQLGMTARARPVRPAPDIYISESDTGVARHGDRVVVRLQRERRRGARAGDKQAGRVIRILERASETIVGTLQKGRQFHYVIPDDPRLPHDVYTTPAHGSRVGDKVVVKLEPWTSRHVSPEGAIVEVLGRSDAPGVDVLAIIRAHRLPTQFTAPALAEADALPDAVPAAALAGRLDLRDQFIITIDPDDARDFDDAVSVTAHPAGGWRLGVHIADVSHYVAPGSALDHEAHGRGNSVYLVDRVLPMLPEKLSNGLCSLRPDEDRLTVSCFLEFDRQLKVHRTEFARTVIRSRHRLTYKQAYGLLEGVEGWKGGSVRKTPVPPTFPSSSLPCTAATLSQLRTELHTMWQLAAKLRAVRFDHGALDLDFPEIKVRLDGQGRPVRLEKIENDISHQLIEEFMLAANEAVAKHLAQRQIPCLHRIHEDPDPGKLRDFRVFAQGFGHKVGDLFHRHQLQKLLAAVEDRPERYAVHLALLKSLKQARYAAQPAGHYGLHKRFYTHFTSPIRRYADLVVHRTLVASLNSQTPTSQTRVLTGGNRDNSGFEDSRLSLRSVPSVTSCSTGHLHAPPAVGFVYPLATLERIADHVSRTEREADEAEKESVELKKLEYFQQQLLAGELDVLDAVVCGVRNFGVFVELPDCLVQGLVHVSTLDDDFYEHDAARERLVGRRTRRVIKVGDRLQVQVERVDLFKRQIDFRVVDG